MLWHHLAIRLGLALILGAFIGAERQWRQRMAGLRTNAYGCRRRQPTIFSVSNFHEACNHPNRNCGRQNFD